MEKQISYKDLKTQYNGYIIIQNVGFYYFVRDFGALFFSEKLHYKLNSDIYSNYKISIPVLKFKKALQLLKESNYNYIITQKNYEITSIYNSGNPTPIIKKKDNDTNTQNIIFTTVQQAIDFVDSVLDDNYKERYSINEFAKKLNVAPTEIILKGEGYSSSLKNILYIYSKRNRNFSCKHIKDELFLARLLIKHVPEQPKERESTPKTNDEPKINFNDLREALKKYRLSKAKEMNVALYYIFENKTIEQIIDRLPKAIDELSSIYGFGKNRLEKYGADIINIVLNFANENNLVLEQSHTNTPTIEIEDAILDCVREFDGKLSRTTISQILKGSKTVANNPLFKKIPELKYFGQFENHTQKSIRKIIDKLIEENKLIIKKEINEYGYSIPRIVINDSCIIKKEDITITNSDEFDEKKDENEQYTEKISLIKDYILKQNKWVEIIEIEKEFGLKRRGKFFEGDNNSTIAHIINRFLKKEGFKTKRINLENDYSIWVASPNISSDAPNTEIDDDLDTKIQIDSSSDSFIDKKEAEKILEIATSTKYDHDTKLSLIQMEFGEPHYEHTNFEGIGRFGSLNQYVLEAYYVLNNFTTRKWISTQKIDSEDLLTNVQPLEFQLVKQNNKTIKYCLYNFCQTVKYKEEASIIKETNDDTALTKRELIDAVMNLVSEYNGVFGRITAIKILTGQYSENDIDKTKHYAKIPNKYANTLITIINSLVKNQKLSIDGKYKLNLATEITIPKKEEDDDKDFLKIVQLIKEGRNVFVTGNAGTGKSYLLNKLKEKYKKKLELTSTTGLAAVNIKGVTIHSWAGVGLCKKPIDQCVLDIYKKKTNLAKIMECKLLAIDEISMLKSSTFSYIDQVLRLVRNNKEPFGGIQLLLFGDFFQLPPIEEMNNEKGFCFESESWKELNLEVVKLEKIYRQTELNFVKALNNIRTNQIDKEDIELLKSREINYDTSNTPMLHIFARNDEADSYNMKKFKALETQTYEYNADSGVYRGEKYIQNDLNNREAVILEIFKKNCRANENLYLKKGCRVMLIVNLDFDKGLINGSCGEIIHLDSDSITVKFDNGVEADIKKNTFEYYYNDSLLAKMVQYPLKLAYGITIHKSQGMTLENVVVDCNRIFEEGQAYVALSRVKKLEGLYLKGFSADKIKANQKVVDFYKNL